MFSTTTESEFERFWPNVDAVAFLYSPSRPSNDVAHCLSMKYSNNVKYVAVCVAH